MKDRKKLLARIRKSLALSASPEPHEAAAALRQAHKLMQEHGVTGAEVQASDIGERHAGLAPSRSRPQWITGLAKVVAGAFIVRVFFTYRGVTFLGREPSVTIASYAFTVLRRRLDSERSAYYRSLRGKRINRIRRADMFALGWVAAVAEMVETFASTSPETDAAIGTYIDLYYPDLVPLAVRAAKLDSRNAADALAGLAAGSNVHLHTAVPHEHRRQIGARS